MKQPKKPLSNGCAPQPLVTALLGAHTASNRTGNGLFGAWGGLFVLQGEAKTGQRSIQQLEGKIHPQQPWPAACLC